MGYEGLFYHDLFQGRSQQPSLRLGLELTVSLPSYSLWASQSLAKIQGEEKIWDPISPWAECQKPAAICNLLREHIDHLLSRRLQQQRFIFSWFWRLKVPRSKCQEDWFLQRFFSLAWRWPPSCIVTWASLHACTPLSALQGQQSYCTRTPPHCLSLTYTSSKALSKYSPIN